MMVQSVLTDKRIAYLRAVAAHEPYEPRHGIVANHCLRLGWVESVIRMPSGILRPWKEMPFAAKGEWVGQRLTDEGRRMLRKADASERGSGD
jgi:hypothetical protein